jgi:2,3,4,5-tetrahydropyridine-2,6-dicarboxylate N-succinyltransferase
VISPVIRLNVNIGAYVGAGTMVDTWVTVGSCAQIGKNVHVFRLWMASYQKQPQSLLEYDRK